MANELVEYAQRKIGPLEAWEWGALAGGAILVYRLITSGHKSTGAQTVTLTPNTQNGLGNSKGLESIGGIVSDLNSIGQQPQNFSITLPDGTVVTWNGSGIVTTPPSGNPVSPNPPAGSPPPVASPSPVPNPLPFGRGGGVIPGATPNLLPSGRGGGVIAGVTPHPLPFGVSTFIPAIYPAPSNVNPTNPLNLPTIGQIGSPTIPGSRGGPPIIGIIPSASPALGR